MIRIVGGGMVGASLACALAQAGRSVTLYERSHSVEVQHDARVSALNPTSLAWLSQLGIQPPVQAFNEMRVFAEYSGDLVFQGDLGGLVVNQALQAAALERAEALGVQVRYAVNARYEQGLWIDDAPVDSDLIIAADGGRSQIRQDAGLELESSDLGQNATFVRVACDQQYTNTTAQVFTVHGPLAFLPVSNDQAVLVWSRDYFADPLPDDAQGIARDASAAFEGRLGHFEGLGSATTVALSDGHARQYWKSGLVLVGDSAHQIHPLAGQGVNLGMADAAALVKALASHHGDAALAKYARARFWHNEGARLAMRGLKNAFSVQQPIWVWARAMGLDAIANSPELRGASQKAASGRLFKGD